MFSALQQADFFPNSVSCFPGRSHRAPAGEEIPSLQQSRAEIHPQAEGELDPRGIILKFLVAFSILFCSKTVLPPPPCPSSAEQSCPINQEVSCALFPGPRQSCHCLCLHLIFMEVGAWFPTSLAFLGPFRLQESSTSL